MESLLFELLLVTCLCDGDADGDGDGTNMTWKTPSRKPFSFQEMEEGFVSSDWYIVRVTQYFRHACSSMFREQFKYFKRKQTLPSLESVINLNNNEDKVISCDKHEASAEVENYLETCGLKASSEWNIFAFIEHPGLKIIQNPFTPEGAQRWIERCLSEYPGPPNKCNLHNHGLLGAHENWWEICQRDKTRRELLINKLRWVTLGYHHNWDTKVYSEESRSAMPEEIALLTYCLGKAVGGWDVRAEAAILNFYRMDSTLSGHTDHSEPNLDAPLFSLSFGQSAIFLIGGKTLDDPTSAIFINSGDIMIMSGESRLCYHGVPKIVPTEWPENSNDHYYSYLKEARINLNIRQVLIPGHETTLK